MGGEAWWAAAHGVAKGRTRLSDFTFTFHFHALEKEMATYSSALAWRILGTGEPGGLPSMGLHIGHGEGVLGEVLGHLMRRVDSLEKTLTLGGIGSRGSLRVGHD